MKWFKEVEFRCPCCGDNRTQQLFYDKIDRVRDQLGRPLTINSGYRCSDHNVAVGGAPGSMHMAGLAADVSIDGMSAELRYLFLSIAMREFRGVGISKNYIHLDARSEHRMWVY